MTKSVTFGVLCCQALAASIGCARVDDRPGGTPDAAPDLPRTASGGAVGTDSRPDAGTNPVPDAFDTDGGGHGAFEAETGPAPICGLFQATLEKLPPDVLVLLDRSASMSDQVLPPGFDAAMFVTCLLLGNCPMSASKWTAMTGAIASSVTTSASDVNYGLKFFPDSALCGVNDGAAVPIAANNAAAMNGAIAKTAPNGATPTAAALASAGRYLTGLTRPNPRFILLATDGEPTCGMIGDSTGSDAQNAISAVSSLATSGIPVYVIGIATAGAADATLSSMATAGGRPRSATPAYYPVQTAADLSAALSAIGKQIASCTFAVKPPDPPADPTNVAVKAGGMRVPKSDTDGWRFGPGMTSIEITGSWCSQIQSGALTDLEATFACAETVIP